MLRCTVDSSRELYVVNTLDDYRGRGLCAIFHDRLPGRRPRKNYQFRPYSTEENLSCFGSDSNPEHAMASLVYVGFLLQPTTLGSDQSQGCLGITWPPLGVDAVDP